MSASGGLSALSASRSAVCGRANASAYRGIVNARTDAPSRLHAAAHKAVKHQGLPDKINIDKSGANAAGIGDYNNETGLNIETQLSKYKNNRVEQDHRFVKRGIRPMLGFKAFHSAKITLAGIKIMPMIRKGQMKVAGRKKQTPVAQFYLLAA